MSAPTREPFTAACDAIRAGADYQLRGLCLTVNGVAMAITGTDFDAVYDLLDELEGDDFDVVLVGPRDWPV